MKQIPVLVFTSDKYLHALRPFAYLFNKYWGSDTQVTVVGFRAPDFWLPGNFHFHSLGNMADYPVNQWSDAVLDYLEPRPELEHFVLMLEDYWLVRPVNRFAIDMLYDYCRQFRNVLKIDLVTDRLYAAGVADYDNCGWVDLIVSDPASQYHMSLMAGLWSRELLLRFLVRGESPWDVEIYGTPRVAAAGSDVLVLGTRQFPLRHLLAHRGGNPNELMLDDLKAVDREALVNLGYIPT